jgi:hypothetical protein
MICAKCGALMDQTDKNTMTGRVIREYLCRSCGHTDWEDDGVALWQVLHDAREEDEAEAAAQAATSAEPEATLPVQNPHTSLWQRLAGLFRGNP